MLPFIFPFIWFLFGCGRIQSVIIIKVTFMLMPTQNAACYVAVCGTEEMNVTRRILDPSCNLEPKTAAEEVPYCISLSTGLLSALSSVFPVIIRVLTKAKHYRQVSRCAASPDRSNKLCLAGPRPPPIPGLRCSRQQEPLVG